jgi:hypothetical protein
VIDKQPGDVIWKTPTVRRFIGWIAVAFPLVLVFGHVGFEDTALPDSISAYYYSVTMHTIFIVFLLVIGVSLIYYQFDSWENWASTLAGLCVIGVVLCPMAADDHITWQTRVGTFHFVFAVLAFGLLGYISARLFTRPHDSAKKPTSLLLVLQASASRVPGLSKQVPFYAQPGDTIPKRRRNAIYAACGLIIALFLVLSALDHVNLLPITWLPHRLFWLESVMLWAFGTAWLVKGGAFPCLRDEQDRTEEGAMALQQWAKWLGRLIGAVGIITGLALLILPWLIRPEGSVTWQGVTVSGAALLSMVGIRNMAAGVLLLWAAQQSIPAQASHPMFAKSPTAVARVWGRAQALFARPLTVVALLWGIVQICDAVLLFSLSIPRIAIAATLLAIASLTVVALTPCRTSASDGSVLGGEGI